MAREFVMGARLQMQDAFSGTIRQAMRQTSRLRDTVTQADRTTQAWRDSTGRLRNELGQFTRAGNAAAEATRKQTSALGKMKGSLTSVHGAIIAVAGAMSLKKGFDWLIGANANMEQYRNTLSVVMGSQEKAVKTLEWANQFAAKTPFEIPQIVEATTRMSAYGINAQKTLGIVGDMASVMGKDLMQAVEAVADAQTGELERLKEFGITKKMIEEQAKLMGASPINNQGQITDTKAFNAALFSLMEKRFKGGMDIQSKSFKGMVSNVKDFIGNMGRQLGAPLFESAKKRLGDFLGFLNRLKDSGALDAFMKNVQRVGAIVGSVFTSSFNVARQNVEMVAGKLMAFYRENKPNIILIGNLLAQAFQKLAAFATPIINWLRGSALPALVGILTTVGKLVLDTAAFFIKNWSTVGPFIYGLAAAWGTFLAVQKAQLAISKIQATWTKIVTAAQWAYNVAMNANPIGIIITLIGLLIGAIIWLIMNWDMVKAKALELWGTIKTAFGNIWASIKSALSKAWTGVKNFFTNLVTSAIDFGKNLIKAIGDGIVKAKDWIVDKVSGVFKAVRDLLPFSDAKKGPFSDLTKSGMAIIKTLGNGITKAKDWLKDKVSGVFKKVRDLLPFSDAKKGPFKHLTSSGGAIMTTLASGIKGQAGTLHKSMTRAFDKAPSLAATAGLDIPAVPKLSTTLDVSTRFDGAQPPTYRSMNSVDAAGRLPAQGGGNSPSIRMDNLVGKIEINGADGDTERMAYDVMDIIYEELVKAKEIIGADKSALLGFSKT